MNRRLAIRFLKEDTKSRTKTINNLKQQADDQQLKEFANQYAALSTHVYTEATLQETRVF